MYNSDSLFVMQQIHLLEISVSTTQIKSGVDDHVVQELVIASTDCVSTPSINITFQKTCILLIFVNETDHEWFADQAECIVTPPVRLTTALACVFGGAALELCSIY